MPTIRCGWRTVVTVASEADPLFNWAQTAGFDAEFCSLGGVVVERIWIPTATQDYSGVIAQIPPTGADGFFVASDPDTVLALARGYPGLRGNISKKMLVGGISLSAALKPRLISGMVLSGPYTGSGPAHALDRYLAALRKTFPRLSQDYMGTAFDIDYHDAMAATLNALDGSGGDLSGGERRFMAALAKVELDAPYGHIRLGRNHQAIQPSYLVRLRTWSIGRPYRTIPNVESTFGGYFKRGDPRRARRRRSAARATRPRGRASHVRSDQVNRVMLAAGASPPGRRPRRTSTTAGMAWPARARAHRPEALLPPAIGEPDNDEAAAVGRGQDASGPGSRSSGSAATPRARWTASDALARSRLASCPPAPSRGPARSSGTSSAPATQAPSSTALQSCSAPTNGTSTGPGWVASPTTTATSQGASREHALRATDRRVVPANRRQG